MALNINLGRISVTIGADTKELEQGQKRARKELNKTDSELKRSGQNWDKWGNAVKIAAVAAGTVAAGQIIKFSDSLTSINNKLKLATNSTGELAKVTEDLFDVSNRTRTSVESTVELYAKLERSTRNLGLSGDELLKVTETVNKSFAISGATAQEASGAIRQLGQALASGALRGDEFNSIAEQAPIILEAVSKATGKTAGELRDLAADGQISAELLINSLQGYADVIDGEFSTATATFAQKLEVANNNAINFVGSNELVQGSVGALGDAIVLLSENLDTFINLGTVAAAVYATRFLPSISIATKGVNMYGASVAAASIKTRAFTVAAGAARGALALLGGPVGILAAVVTSLALFVDWESDAEKQAERLTKAIKDQELATQDLTRAQRDVALQQLSQEQDNLLAKIKESQTEIAKLTERTQEAVGPQSLWTTKTKEAVRALDDEKKKLKELQAELDVVGAKLSTTFEGGLPSQQEMTDQSGDLGLGLSEEETIARGQKQLEAEKEIQAQRLTAFGKHLEDMQRKRQEAETLEKEERQKAADEFLMGLQERFATESEFETMKHEEDMARLREALELERITKDEFRALEEEAAQRHQKRLTEIERAEQEARRQVFNRNAGAVLNAIGTLGKKSVKIQKAVALAQAAIAISTGIARANELGFPANIAEIARVVTVGASAISQIKSQNVGSATTPTAPGGGGGGSVASAAQAAPSQAAAQSQGARRVDIRLSGEGAVLLGEEQLQSLIGQINEAVNDGSELNT